MKIAYLLLVLSTILLLVGCYNANPTESTEEGMPPMKVEQVEEVTTEQDNIDDVVGDTPPVPDSTDQ